MAHLNADDIIETADLIKSLRNIEDKSRTVTKQGRYWIAGEADFGFSPFVELTGAEVLDALAHIARDKRAALNARGVQA